MTSVRCFGLAALLLCIVLITAPLAAQACPCAAPAPTVQALVPDVIAVFPHDTESWTQGLLLHDGTFYESAGEFGRSDIRQVAIETGAIIRKTEFTERFAEQAASLFAEGLALVDDQLIQLTWQNRSAIVWDLATFEVADIHFYETEGWGLCYDGAQLYMSDGSSSLFVRDAQSFRLRAMIPVTREGEPVPRLNELECVGDHVYANVWQSPEIVRIDKATGYVDAVIDASALVAQEPSVITELSAVATALATRTPNAPAPANPSDAVLNGIAYNPDSDTFYITGKFWSQLYEVRFVPPGS
jgi:glutaminyl-peptide cyclotransferase